MIGPAPANIECLDVLAPAPASDFRVADPPLRASQSVTSNAICSEGRNPDPGGLEPHLGGLAHSASVVMQERSLLQDVSGDIATLLQPHGAGAAEMDSDQHARERVLARRI